MNEKPILFSGPMVRAILNGQKTQTRRVVKLRPGQDIDNGVIFSAVDPFQILSPYGQPGDRLWIRETWQQIERSPKDWNEFAIVAPPLPGIGGITERQILYAATHTGEPPPKWRPSIHMPRWASRLSLTVTGVRVERLQDISEDDADAEGVGVCPVSVDPESPGSHALEFAALWDSINGKPRADGVDISWAANPWVWVVQFELIVPPLSDL